MKADFRDKIETQSIGLPKVVNFRKFTFRIDDYYYSEGGSGNCAAEIQFFLKGKRIPIDIENYQYKPQYSTERTAGSAVVNTDGISLLDKPDAGAKTVSRLAKGARLNLYEMTRSPVQIDNTCSYWFGVENDQFRGYCFGYYLDILDSGDTPNYSFNSMVKDFNSSGFLQKDESDLRFHPAKAFDGDPHSFWIGNEKNGGIGDYLEIIFFKPQQCGEIEIRPGAFQEDLFGKYNRVKKATIRLDAFPITVDFTDLMESRVVKIPGDIKFSKFKITIDEVYPGGAYNRPCISDILFDLRSTSYSFRIPIGFLPNLSGKSIHTAALPYFYSVSYYFPDGTYVAIFGGYEKHMGIWKTDAEGNVETYAAKRYYIKGIGDGVDTGMQFESQLFEDYMYTVETSNNVCKFNMHDFTIDINDETGRCGVYEIQGSDSEVRNTMLTPEIEKYIEEKKARYKEFIEQNRK
ncbi:MAG: hypothetical protein E4H36_11920 [Spirochaetales bacterium]|nr:MAG: hypothetical protein E4H36_11920 [Spirochaetales bacterium]